MNAKSTVVSIHVAPIGRAAMQPVAEVRAVARKGLEGDRYFSQLGTYSQDAGSGRDLTLIELEAIDALQRDYKVVLDPGSSRRNIVTRGVALNHLVGREFYIGEVVARERAVRESELELREDLVTRLAWGLVYQLHALTDEEKARALAERATSRGFRLRREVADFLLTRARRDLPSLLAMLDALDRYSLETKRPITVPLARELLSAAAPRDAGSPDAGYKIQDTR